MTGIRHRRDVADMSLSPRERVILDAYARLGDQHAVAEELCLSHHTVKNALSDAYAKLGAQSALEAFRLLGWLVPS
mgnify:CR=1 FL=1